MAPQFAEKTRARFLGIPPVDATSGSPFRLSDLRPSFMGFDAVSPLFTRCPCYSRYLYLYRPITPAEPRKYRQPIPAPPTWHSYSHDGRSEMGGIADVLGRCWRRVFVVLQDYLSSITVNWMSFLRLAVVIVVLFFPAGCWASSARRSGMSVLECRQVSKSFGSLFASARLADLEQGELRRRHRAERRRQDDLLQFCSALFPPQSRAILFEGRMSPLFPADRRVGTRHGTDVPITEIFPI